MVSRSGARPARFHRTRQLDPSAHPGGTQAGRWRSPRQL